MCCICGRTTTKWMVAYLKAFVAYLKAYVFSKFSDWQSMKSMMTVSSMEYVSTLTRSTWAQHDASGTANRRPALPEILCVSKMMIASKMMIECRPSCRPRIPVLMPGLTS
jgi:hypothetical protein